MRSKFSSWYARHPKRNRAIAAVLVTGLLGLVVASTTVAVSAEFVDTHSGTITGQLGHVELAPNGGTGADHGNFVFPDKFEPGKVQTVTGSFTNAGSLPQDVYIVFNPTALSALNTFGTFGEVHVSVNGKEIFASANLNDNHTSCPPGSTTPSHPIPCAELPGAIKLLQNLAPGDSATWSFGFGYADKLSSNPPSDVDWNPYPTAGQVTDNDADGSGSGLPYQLSGVQAGGNAPVYKNS